MPKAKETEAKVPQGPEWVVKTEPTKELFINMLTRDLTLRDAISDLVDNSVDAVRELVNRELPERPNKDLQSRRYTGFELNIDYNENEFIIKDNCGGLEAGKARDYAFRFGRDKDAPPTPGSIGQFGIGMKRALFKLGKNFHIKSVAANSDFVLDVPVDEWAEPGKPWDFHFTDLHENVQHALAKRMMLIKVSQLNPDAVQAFRPGDKNAFESSLVTDIGREHVFTISNGLTIKVNGTPISSADLTLLDSKEFKVGTYKRTAQELTDIGELAEVKVRIFVGVSSKKLKEGGWYVFCNDRLIAGPEQSAVTGWTGTGSDGIPVYHDQYARFRGYVFFDSDNAGALPWNTTKTSMDLDSKLYQSTRKEMINMARPVITFLNALKRENESSNTSQQKPLHQALNAAKPVSVLAIEPTQQAKKFTAPVAKRVKAAPVEQVIRYTVAVEEFNEVQHKLGVTKDEVGPALFQYYYRNEVE